MSQMEKLASVGGDPLGSLLAPDLPGVTALHGPLGKDLFAFLMLKNGFYAFESALHVFPFDELALWNEPSLWKAGYGRLLREPLLCFAQDVFGGQFCIAGRDIVSLDPETGETKKMASTLEEWAKAIVGDYEFHTGYPLAHEWQQAHGPLPRGKRLVPKKPFVLGGEYAADNVFAMDAAQSLRMRGEIAQQIADLPDGTEVDIEYR